MSIFSSVGEGVWGHSNNAAGISFDLEEDNLFFIDTAYSGCGYLRIGIFQDPLNKVGLFQVPKAELLLTREAAMELIEQLSKAVEIEWPL